MKNLENFKDVELNNFEKRMTIGGDPITQVIAWAIAQGMEISIWSYNTILEAYEAYKKLHELSTDSN